METSWIVGLTIKILFNNFATEVGFDPLAYTGWLSVMGAYRRFIFMFWTRESVEEFIKNNPVDTGGAITKYCHDPIEEIDDGDITFKVRFPFWPNNNSVCRSVMQLAVKAIDDGGRMTHVQINDINEVTIYFDAHWCDPD